MMLGFGAFNNGDYAIAITAWTPLAAALDPQSRAWRLLAERLAQAERLLALPADGPPPPPAVSSIVVTIDLQAELKAGLSGEDILFVFARAVNGPPMPLAAVRQPARDFPVQVVLDDERAMLPSLKLSDFQEITVGARISRSGAPTAQSGDFQSLTRTLHLDGGPLSVALTVDQVVP